ncbi:(2Fe-2S) ferredoxin domain-containing protein [Sphingosinicella microcystinivorans]|uniref:(2Fe-2S) ferredoxin domain-containing protein n=1 Tax=Sphingosinicella microcystinivorans TaxID=335406 RepID=UPI0022F38714|nr:(2Fe-2S) ferredoxin domain-containing protein [Sphingosinicella microcystinivorans]WBX85278.1 (2Fe-2S) ferredoxin domain-containing protein [Sphingosinicella microcystinivorans]
MKTVPARWEATILICRKCSRKLGGGFGKNGRKSLAKALRARGLGGKGRKAGVGIVEVGCLDICPKNGVVAMNAANPGAWLVVPKGADIDAVAERLGLDGERKASRKP